VLRRWCRQAKLAGTGTKVLQGNSRAEAWQGNLVRVSDQAENRQMKTALRRGARGYLVERLQEALGGLRCDGVFGGRTEDAVRSLQGRLGLTADGAADAAVWRGVGLDWPDEFERCLSLTGAFEGTGFSGCNATDIDGAGLTVGIAGFTTASGEVQRLVAEFVRRVPEPLALLSPDRRAALLALAEGRSDRAAWERFVFGASGRLSADVRALFAAWGEHPVVQAIQRAYVRSRFWDPALKSALRLGLRTMAARGFMLDVWVQNGGWRAAHEAVFRAADRPEAPEPLRLRHAARAVASQARARWREDVLARKLVFAAGAGTVHGVRYALDAFGFSRGPV